MAKYEYWINDEGLLLVEGWARDGLIDEQISHNMGISYSTFKEWKKKFSDFSTALKKGKEVVDRQVENALFKRAIGYQWREVKIQKSSIDTITTTTTKEVSPDVTAQIFWLKNRKQEWREQQNSENKQDKDIAEALRGLVNGIDT